MPPKKRGSIKKKKEVLPEPHTLSNGECDYYIGSWSYHQNIDAVSDIAHSVVEQHTSEDGEVGTLPRTNILIPAGNLGDAKIHYAVEVADNMFIESVPKSSIKKATELKTEPNTEEGGETVEPEEATPVQQQKEEEVTEESPAVNEPTVGASLKCQDVILQGTVHIDGIVTRIVIKPDLPNPPTPPPAKRRRSSTKRKKSAKAMEEEQQRLAEAAKEYEDKVNAAVEAARKEEDFKNQFAHPDRWSHVVFSNMTFAGQVIVSHAHVTFRNCCFSAKEVDITQLLVTQYCQVECIKCTFMSPAKGSVYGLPRGKLTFQKCLFTGSSNVFSTSEEPVKKEVPKKHPKAVGLHTDACIVLVEDCEFAELETAILLRGSHPDETAEKPAMVVRDCKVENIYGSGIVLNGVRGVELMKNKFTDCEYYSLDCVKGKDIRVFQNSFRSEVRVRDAAQVKFMHNKCGTVPLTLKEVDNPNWQPVY